MGFSGPIKTKNETNHVKEDNMVKIPADRRQTSWLLTSVAKELNFRPPRKTPLHLTTHIHGSIFQEKRKRHAFDSEKAGRYTAVCLARRLKVIP